MIHTISGRTSDFTGEFDKAIAEYRHRIFIERLGWQLPVADGMERDQFDRTDTVYVVARDSRGAICGCARLLPTTGPYLLRDIFPDLLGGLPSPASPDVWELSRFAAVALDEDKNVNAAANTRGMLAAAVGNAEKLGARRLITVSPIGVERLLHRLGVHAHRAAPPRFVDGKPIFACWIEIDQQTRNALNVGADDPGFNTH